MKKFRLSLVALMSLLLSVPMGIKAADGLITSVDQLSSPYTEPTEGSLAFLLDGDANTMWHSNWSDGSVAPGTHYLQVELNEAHDADLVFVMTRRLSSNDHITKMSVYGAPTADASKDECTLLLEGADLPYVRQGETVSGGPFSTQGFTTLRFYIDDTYYSGGSRGYGHMTEFQLYEYTPENINLAGKVVSIADTADDDVSANQWYLVVNYWSYTGASNLMHDRGCGADLDMSAGFSAVYDGMDAEEAAPYLARFIATEAEDGDLHGAPYYMQFATGHYFSVGKVANTPYSFLNTWASLDDAEPVYVYQSMGRDKYMTISTTDDDSHLDNFGPGDLVIKGDQGESYDASYTDDVWFLVPVTLNSDTGISGLNILKIGDAITTQPEEDKWYIVQNNRGNSMTPAGDNGVGSIITRASSESTVTAGKTTAQVGNYLVRFIPTGDVSEEGVGGVYRLQFGTGNYWEDISNFGQGTGIKTVDDESEAGIYNVYPTVDGGDTFGLNAFDMGKKVDNNGVGSNVVGWDSGVNDATSGNNVWWIHEVTLGTQTAEEIALSELIEVAEDAYEHNNGQVDTGFSAGDGVGNGLITSTSQFSSPYTESSEGSLDNLLDNTNTTFWHSEWSNGSVDNGVHYLQVDMNDDFNGGDLVVYILRRNASDDQVTEMTVKDGNDTEIATLTLPYAGAGTYTQDIFTCPEGIKTLRFYEEHTTGSSYTDRGYFHLANFQLFYTSQINPDYNNRNNSVAKSLTDAIATANEVLANIASATQADIDALQAAIDYYNENIGLVSDDDEFAVGDTYLAANHLTYAVTSSNLFLNGGFDEGVDGWKTVGYETPADLSNFGYSTEGGFNGGAYITTQSAAGVGSEATIRQSTAVEVGKSYLFVAYTSGNTPESNNYQYNGLFNMTDAVTEDGSAFIQLNWGEEGWTQTASVFTATTPYVGFRSAWNDGVNLDGIQLYEVEFAGDMPVEDGEYLLVNTETGYYLGGGLSWGTKATMLAKPQFFALEGQADGTYTLDSHQYNSDVKHYLGDADGELYLDAVAAEWTLEDAGDGNITIYCTELGGYLTGAETTQKEPTTSEELTDAALWTLVTRADVIASMDDAPIGGTVDVTALIASPELKRNSNTSYYPTWTVTAYGDEESAPTNYSFGNNENVANCAESYRSTNGFDIHQTLTDLKAGTYKLSAQGFYNDYNAAGYGMPVLYAGDVEATLQPIRADEGNIASDQSMVNAYQDFLAGLYPVSLEFTVSEDNEPVVIGFKGDQTEDNPMWNIFGELTLEYEAEPILFLVHECVADIDHWTTTGNNGTFVMNDWSTEADESGMVVPFCQNWVGSESTLTDATISHTTLTDLEAGDYTIVIDARIFSEAGNEIAAGTTLSANGESIDIVEEGTATTYGTSNVVYGTYTVNCTVGDAGTLDISFGVKDATYNWLAWKNLKVYQSVNVAPEVAAAEGMMNANVEAAQTAALEAYAELPSANNYYAAVDAVAAAEESIAYYASITDVLNTFDEDGQSAFESSAYGRMYVNRTLTSQNVSSSLASACKAQTTPGADMTYLMTATSWTGQTGTYADGVERYGDEIAVEDEVVKVLYQSITGMQSGIYEVSFYGVANNAWVGAAVGEGIAQAFANSETEDIEVYDQTACTPTDYPHTFTVTVGSDGKLEYGLQNIATGGNWYVCQAISLTLVELVEIIEPTPYEFVCTEWMTMDVGRVLQSSISYDETANTITVNATGTNNVALGNMNVETGEITTANSIVTIEKNWLTVCASNVSMADGDSYLWWLNGTCWGTSVAPTLIAETEDGQVVMSWDITESGINDTMLADENLLDGWTGFGLTSTTGSSVISDINFYTEDELLSVYPELGVTVGIDGVAAEGENDAIYTVAGVRVSNMKQPGIYIVNGKKVLVK